MNSIGLGKPSTSTKSNHPRQSSSSAYQLFDSKQLQTFKEAFNFLDLDNDGFIDGKDLKGVFEFLGQPLSAAQLSSLLACRPQFQDSSSSSNNSLKNQITFPIFIQMLTEQLQEMDLESDLLEAFSCFDTDDSGVIDSKELGEALKAVGEKMSDAEIQALLKGPFTDKNNKFHYRKFCETLRVSEIEEGEVGINEGLYNK